MPKLWSLINNIISNIIFLAVEIGSRNSSKNSDILLTDSESISSIDVTPIIDGAIPPSGMLKDSLFISTLSSRYFPRKTPIYQNRAFHK